MRLLFIIPTLLFLAFSISTHAYALNPDDYIKVKIESGDKLTDSEWSDASESFPENWFKDVIEPALVADSVTVRGERTASYKAPKTGHPALATDNLGDGPLSMFSRHYWDNHKAAADMGVAYEFEQITPLDSCAYRGNNFWEFEVQINYQISRNPSVKTLKQKAYILVTDKKHDRAKDDQKLKRISEWKTQPINYCLNNQPFIVDSGLVNLWLDNHIFKDLDIGRFTAFNDKSYKGLSLGENVIPSLTFSHLLQKTYPKGSKTEGAINITRKAEAELVDTCRDYGLTYWQFRVPVAYSFNIGGKDEVMEEVLYIGAREKQEKDNTPYRLLIESWSHKNNKYCEHVTKKQTNVVTSKQQDSEIQNWVKDNLPDGFTFYFEKNHLYMPKNIYNSNVLGPMQSHLLTAKMISFLVKEKDSATSKWFNNKTSQGKLILADTPIFFKSCAKETMGTGVKEYTWDMQWPVTLDINGKQHKHERWIHVKRIEKGGQAVKTLFYGFDEKTARVCDKDNILNTMKLQNNQQKFRELLEKAKEN